MLCFPYAGLVLVQRSETFLGDACFFCWVKSLPGAPCGSADPDRDPGVTRRNAPGEAGPAEEARVGPLSEPGGIRPFEPFAEGLRRGSQRKGNLPVRGSGRRAVDPQRATGGATGPGAAAPSSGGSRALRGTWTARAEPAPAPPAAPPRAQERPDLPSQLQQQPPLV